MKPVGNLAENILSTIKSAVESAYLEGWSDGYGTGFQRFEPIDEAEMDRDWCRSQSKKNLET